MNSQDYSTPPSEGPLSEQPQREHERRQRQEQSLPALSLLSVSQSSPLLAQQDTSPTATPPPLPSPAAYPSIPPLPPSISTSSLQQQQQQQISTPDQSDAGSSVFVSASETHPIHLPFTDILGASSSSPSSSLSSPRPQLHSESRQRRPTPHPLRPALSSARSRTTAPASASPSTWSIASTDTGPSSASSVVESRIRFEQLPNGQHRHNLSAPKRQQFLSNQVRRLRELLDGRKEREDLQQQQQQQQISMNNSSQAQLPQLRPDVYDHPLSLLNEKYQEMEHDQQTSSPSGSFRRRHSVRTDFVQKYGDLQQVVGKGAFGTVRLSVKKNWETGEEHVYAIKEFKFTHGESQKQYMRRLTSEFCIASSLRHVNVIHTMDLLQLQGDTYSEVMEYCSGGDMHSLIASANSLGESESNCFFAQLVNGVAFLHAMGVVHRDLKPENLLLSADGCLKIADFGNSEVFRMPWEKKVRSSASIRGSGPFIAPEEFTNKTFDARKVDMWSCGIIYMCMRLGRYTWHEASDGDPIWDGYLYKRARYLEMKEEKGQEDQVPSHINLTSLEQASHTTLGLPTYIADVLENLLEPDTRKRWQANKVLDSEWFKQIDNCHPSERQPDQILDESDFEIGTTKATRLGQQQPSQRVGSKVVPLDSSVTGCKIVKEVRDRRATSSGEPGESVVARAS